MDVTMKDRNGNTISVIDVTYARIVDAAKKSGKAIVVLEQLVPPFLPKGLWSSTWFNYLIDYVGVVEIKDASSDT